MHCHSLRQHSGSTGTGAAYKTLSVPYAVPSSGRGGTTSTSGRGQFSLAPVRAVRLTNRGVLSEAAALQQGGLGISELLNKDLAETVLTPRRIMNRRIKSCRSLVSLTDLVLDEILNFDHQNVSHALSRLAKMARGLTRGQGHVQAGSSYSAAARQQNFAELQPAVDVLTRRMHQLIRNFDSWDVTLSLWSYAQLGYHDEAALRALCEAALPITPIFKPVDCANAVVAFAYLDYLHTDLLRQIVTVVLDTIDDFQPGEVCQVLWGFAKLGCHPGAMLLHEAVATVHRSVRQYGTQELVLVIWALVRLGYKPGVRFLYDVETTLLQRLPHMAPADLSLSVWTFAHLRYKAVRLLDEVPAVVGPQLRNCSNAELCSLASGFATSHHYHRVLLDSVAGVVLSRLEKLTHQEVCIVLWTYGTFRHRPVDADFSKQMAATLYSRMTYFAPQGLAMIVKALAQLQWRSEPLLAALIEAAEGKLNAFKPLELSQLLWGLTTLDCKDLNIYYAVVRRCIAILKDPLHPQYRTMMQHRVVNSVIASCQQLGYVPWTLIDFAESKGIRVKEPGILNSRDEEDEGMLTSARPAAARLRPAAATGAKANVVERDQAGVSRARPEPGEDLIIGGQGQCQAKGEEEPEVDAEDVQEEADCSEEDVGTQMAADLANGLANGRRRRGAQERGSPSALLQLEQDLNSQPEQGARQERQLHAVGSPTPLDQHAPLRVGLPHHHHHRQGHGHNHHSQQQANTHDGSGDNEGGAGEVAKVLIPRPRAPRRSSAPGEPTAAAGHAPPHGHAGKSPPSLPPQQEQIREHQEQQGFAHGITAPLPLSPPPPLKQPSQPLGLRDTSHSNGSGSSIRSGNGRDHRLPETPWLALGR